MLFLLLELTILVLSASIKQCLSEFVTRVHSWHFRIEYMPFLVWNGNLEQSQPGGLGGGEILPPSTIAFLLLIQNQ